jgi:hypothetical protein
MFGIFDKIRDYNCQKLAHIKVTVVLLVKHDAKFEGDSIE